MCGIGGWYRDTSCPITDEDLARLQTFVSNAIQELQIRGQDATGIAVIDGEDNNKLTKLTKKCLPAHVFGKSKAFKKTLEAITPETKTVLLHTRAGTHGANQVVNAHPIHSGRIVGIHNGVISNYSSLASKFDAKKLIRGETDSEHLFASLNLLTMKEQDIFPKLKEPLEEISGSAAIAVVQLGNPNLYMFRKNNPTSVFYDPSTRTLFWLSQFNMGPALRLAGLDRAHSSGMFLPENTLFQVDSSLFTDESAVSRGSIKVVSKVVKKYSSERTVLGWACDNCAEPLNYSDPYCSVKTTVYKTILLCTDCFDKNGDLIKTLGLTVRRYEGIKSCQ